MTLKFSIEPINIQRSFHLNRTSCRTNIMMVNPIPFYISYDELIANP